MLSGERAAWSPTLRDGVDPVDAAERGQWVWNRESEEKECLAVTGFDPSVLEPVCRRSHYRVAGIIPIRLTALAIHEVEAAIFDLSLPDPSVHPAEGGDENAALIAQLRRIEEKLDLLLDVARVEIPRQLSGRDRQSIVFSGSGLSLDVTWSFLEGDAYRVEILLPSPYSRCVRAVGLVVEDAPADSRGDALRTLALELRYMETEDRDALVAFSYDLQRIALRNRGDGERHC